MARFELLVGEAYRRQGYRVRQTGQNGPDGGIDLLMTRQSEVVIVQCKHWKTWRVGPEPVRALVGVMPKAKAHRCIFVTSGNFTQASRSYAQGLPIELINGERLVQLLASVRDEAIAAINAPQQAIGKAVPKEDVIVGISTSPACPTCGGEMVLRTAKQGENAGSQFWGCPRFPSCRGIRNLS